MMTIDNQLAEFNKKFSVYTSLFSGTSADALAKQGKEFSGFLAAEMKSLAPGKEELKNRLLDRAGERKGWRIHDEKTGGGEAGQKDLIIGRLVGDFKNTAKNRKATARARKVWEKAMVAGHSDSQAEYGRTVEFDQEFKSSAGRFSFQALRVENEINRRTSKRMFTAAAMRITGNFFAKADSGKDGETLGSWTPQFNGTDNVGIFLWGGKVGKASWIAAKALSTAIGQAAIQRALAATQANMQVYIDRKLKEQGAMLSQ